MIKRQSIGSLLVEYGLITNDDLEEALALQGDTGRKLGEVLIDQGKITQQDIEWILSKQLDIPYIIVDEAGVDKALLSRFKKDFLIENRILPLYESDEEIAIVTDDPFNTQAFGAIEEQTQKRVNLSGGSGEAIRTLLLKLLKREGAPELAERIRWALEALQETSFYRIDFHLHDYGLTMRAFGCGLSKVLYESDLAFKPEDVENALRSLDIAYLTEQHTKLHERLLCVYPIVEHLETKERPVVLGRFGLGMPEGICFTDLETNGMRAVFENPRLVPGYDYLCLHPGHVSSGRVIYTPDSMPRSLESAWVEAYAPSSCSACQGKGCESCRDLGYKFSPVQGQMSRAEIEKLFFGGLHA